MARAVLSSGIEIEYEEIGAPDDPAMLLVMGFTAQLITWPEGFLKQLADQGYRVIVFDNRDCGLSTKLDGQEVDVASVLLAGSAIQAGGSAEMPAVPYTLSDMADDAVGLLDHLGIGAAHIVGASMGGMIAQHIAIEHPSRTLTLTSIMSVSGELEYGSPLPEAAEVLLSPPAEDRATYIADSVKTAVWSSKRYFDADLVRDNYARSYDRSFYPEGANRQLAAIYASGSRAEALAALTCPTLVVHGRDDALLPPSGGVRTAELVPSATLLLVADMGHDLPEPLWPLLTTAIGANARL